MANTRMKDFYDLWKLSHDFDFDGALLTEAITATFKRRGTEVLSGTPLALTDEFSRDAQKTKQWQAFLKKSSPFSDVQRVQVADCLGHVYDCIQRVNDGFLFVCPVITRKSDFTDAPVVV